MSLSKLLCSSIPNRVLLLQLPLHGGIANSRWVQAKTAEIFFRDSPIPLPQSNTTNSVLPLFAFVMVSIHHPARHCKSTQYLEPVCQVFAVKLLFFCAGRPPSASEARALFCYIAVDVIGSKGTEIGKIARYGAIRGGQGGNSVEDRYWRCCKGLESMRQSLLSQ